MPRPTKRKISNNKEQAKPKPLPRSVHTPSVRLTFYGAAQTVTGSRYILESGKVKILVDCGLFQGKLELRERNWEDPGFDPKTLTSVVLTHAHIDHVGYLPVIVRKGYRGPIYCSAPTARLVDLLLRDSAELQIEEARYANKHQTSRHSPAKPLYDLVDAKRALSQLVPFKNRGALKLTPQINLTTACAGHILGSNILSFEIGSKRVTFSGDIGRYNTPLLPDPAPVDLGDLALCESTYGNRDHQKQNDKLALARVINAAAKRRGPLIIPAFAIGRTQALLYYISELERSGTIPVLPVYIDSPMGIDATEIYREFHSDFDHQAKNHYRNDAVPLKSERTTFCRKVSDSKKLNQLRGARVIIAGSGMATGGRVLHHLMHWLDHEETTVLFVGYQAEGSRGRMIASGEESVRIFGQDVPVRATVESISGLSAHGDRNELLRWLKSCRGSPKHLKIVHGEPEPSAAFAALAREKLGLKASVAEFLETVEI